MSWHTLLALGGIGSGRLEFAESLLSGAVADQLRRVRAEGKGAGAGLAALASLLSEAKPDETLLVTDVAAWLSGEPGSDDPDRFARFAQAVRDCPARVVLVSPEAGLAPAPSAATTRNRALALGALNHALAEAVDAVALVIAGLPMWLKGSAAAVLAGAGAPVRGTTAAVPGGEAPGANALRDLPSPDEDARTGAAAHLAGLGAVRLGALETVVTFAAATQGTPHPVAWPRVRVLVLHGNHGGAAAAGALGSAARAAQLREGAGPLAHLAGAAGAQVRIVEVAAAAPIEAGPAMTDEAVEAALAHGWRLAGQAADEGVDAIVLGSIGDGAETAAAAVVSVLAPNTEPAALLPRLRTADGTIDDQAWIARCAAVRDAVHRVRSAGRTGTRPVLAELAGPDLTTAAGLILGAAARRTPVLLDGPVGTAAALAARGLALPSRHWCLLPDHGRHPTAARASEVLNLTPLLDLELSLGEGAAALAALPLLRSALVLAATAPAAPGGRSAGGGRLDERGLDEAHGGAPTPDVDLDLDAGGQAGGGVE